MSSKQDISPLQSQWPADSKQYNLIQKIGFGAFSGVWKAICLANNQEVAIKVMDLEKISTSFEDILQEVQTMRLSNDENVLACYSSFVFDDELWLVMQLMNKGSCLRVMNVAKAMGFGRGMNEEWIAYILKETLQGLSYLHTNGQIHRDIKSGNILLADDGSVRLADFGVAGWTMARGTRNGTCRTFVGTPCWMAPEVMEQLEGYDYRADIWSIGITSLELAKGFAPYANYAPMRVLVLTIEEEPPSLRSYENDRQRTGAPFSKGFEEFYKKCLQKNPKSRPMAEELLKLKFFKGRSKESFLSQYLSKISPVGSDDVVIEGRERDFVPPVKPVDVSESEGCPKPRATRFSVQDEADDYVAGTTWVFETGSVSSSGPSQVLRERGPGGNDESLEGFIEDFEAKTATLKEAVGSARSPPVVVDNTFALNVTHKKNMSQSAPVSTGDFMDEFEDEVGSGNA